VKKKQKTELKMNPKGICFGREGCGEVKLPGV
jgi:hypothetical protein